MQEEKILTSPDYKTSIEVSYYIIKSNFSESVWKKEDKESPEKWIKITIDEIDYGIVAFELDENIGVVVFNFSKSEYVKQLGNEELIKKICDTFVTKYNAPFFEMAAKLGKDKTDADD